MCSGQYQNRSEQFPGVISPEHGYVLRLCPGHSIWATRPLSLASALEDSPQGLWGPGGTPSPWTQPLQKGHQPISQCQQGGIIFFFFCHFIFLIEGYLLYRMWFSVIPQQESAIGTPMSPPSEGKSFCYWGISDPFFPNFHIHVLYLLDVSKEL